MRNFSDIGFRVGGPKDILLFLLGLFSTLQIIQVAGFALSTWLTVLTALYLILTHGLNFRKDWLLLLLLASCILTLFTGILSDLPGGYQKAAVMGAVQWLLIFVICSYMRKERDSASMQSFFRGFDWSCKIQLTWCVLQMGLYYALGKDINAALFGKLLHMSNETSQYRNGVLACTGLHWHAANLIPILIYVYFRYRALAVKVLCFVLVYLTKNATALIAIGGAVFLDFVMFAKRTLCDRRCAIRYKVAVYATIGILGVLVISPVILPKVQEVIEYLLLRLYQIQNPTAGNESSAVHFNYYKNLPDILSRIPLQEVLFGSGIGTSGHRFSTFYHQYVGQIWTVESDPVNLTLSIGVVGAVLHYCLLLRIAFLAVKQKQPAITCFILVLIVSGFIYDNQFLWVQLVEFLLYCRLLHPPVVSPDKGEPHYE